MTTSRAAAVLLGLLTLTVVGIAALTLTPDGRSVRGTLLDHTPVLGTGTPAVADDETGRIRGTLDPHAHHPALDRLDPALLAALLDATADAERDGVELRVTSGWRSRGYQQDLLDAAIEKYGSREEARRWVQTPDGSSHTTGDAVDVGPTDAAYWLSRFGSAYGLCQSYSNEIWHYELTVAPGEECPAPAAP